MRHEYFDTERIGLMAGALEAAVQTLRLTGVEADDALRWAMARRILAAASEGDHTSLLLAQAALTASLRFRLPAAHRSSA